MKSFAHNYDIKYSYLIEIYKNQTKDGGCFLLLHISQSKENLKYNVDELNDLKKN